jgi:iron complex outermembrane recepter protein
MLGLRVLKGSLLAGVALTAASARAADADTAAPSVPEIVVTATKRAENVQKVPISMEVLSGKQLQQFHATDVKSVMNSVPNVYVEQTAGNDVVYIRGFGSPPANFSFDQSVSMYVDGVYAGHVRQEQAPFFDLERTEVLRGPQGALFGKNTAAGAISVVSAGPTAKLAGAIDATYNFSQRGFDVTAWEAGPVTDTLGARIAVRVQDQDGYIRNLADGNQEPHDQMQMFRGTLKWTPGPSFDTTLKFEYENVDKAGGYNSSGSLTAPEAPSLTRYATANPLGQEGLTNKSILTSNTANVYFGGFTLTSVTGYSWYSGNVINGFDQQAPDSSTIVNNSIFNAYPETFNQFSQEVRLLSPTGQRLEYIVGAYYDTSTYHLQQLTGFDLLGFNADGSDYKALQHTWFDQKAHSESVFGQATFHATEWARLIGSLRWTSTHKTADFYGALDYGPYALQTTNTTANGAMTEDHTDPTATIQIDATRDVMLYGTYGQGSKSGGFVSNTYGTTDATFHYLPETSRNFEVGVKFKALDRRLTGSVSLYDTRFKDLQVSIFDPALDTYITGNAASATSKGVEAALGYRASRHFDLSATGAYMDIKYDDYPGAQCLAIQTQCTNAATNNLAGYRPPYTSKWSGSLTAHGAIDLPHDLTLNLTGVAAGRSGYFDSDNENPTFGYQGAYVKFDGRIEITSAAWHIALVGRNLGNHLTVGSAFELPYPLTAVPRAIKYVEPPRSVAIEAGVRF